MTSEPATMTPHMNNTGTTIPRTQATIVNLPSKWLDCEASPDRERCLELHRLLASLTSPSSCAASQEDWTVSKPCRGLGDVVAKVAHATGIARAVKAVTGGDCGCGKRQAALNKAVPFGPQKID